MRRLALVIVLIALGGMAWISWDLYRPYRAYSGDQFVLIEPGTNALGAANLLVERGVLAHRWPLLFRYWLGRAHHRLKAGEYLFDRPLRPVDVYRKLILGDVFLHTVVIPEGSDRFDMARVLHQQLGLNPEEFLRTTEQTSAIRDLDPRAPSLEGYLFPDTYRFPRSVTSAGVVEAMLARFRQVWANRIPVEGRPPCANLHDVITLASLVEKETPSPGERPVVAAVFRNRLEKGMALQCDPTVIYAARLNRHPLGPITEDDLEIDSPFNTYRYAGLPPGPIASPGEASIRAALEPAAVDFLYFVSNNRGGHLFSRNLVEHQRNVARYRREVAALRRVTAGEAKNASSLAGQRGKSDATSSSKPRVKSPEQKTSHPRSLPGAGSRPRGGKGDSSHPGRSSAPSGD
ncbi:MAG: endolytic transglycosylase MltG [Acidobacteriia bacterium]|nr:endolytic transglycosylase MltG [Terriglobia bacterium]